MALGFSNIPDTTYNPDNSISSHTEEISRRDIPISACLKESPPNNHRHSIGAQVRRGSGGGLRGSNSSIWTDRTKLPLKGWKKGISSHLSSHTMSEEFADGYTLVTLGIKKAFRLGKANKVNLLKKLVPEVGVEPTRGGSPAGF